MDVTGAPKFPHRGWLGVHLMNLGRRLWASKAAPIKRLPTRAQLDALVARFAK
jgi:hypothetical protein